MKLSKDDMNYIEGESRNNPVHKYFENVAAFDFNVGDILIRKVRDGDLVSGQYHKWSDVPWKILKISPISRTNKKFIVVYVDEFGVPYVKHIRVDGTFGSPTCLGYVNDCAMFEHDPDYADHILLHGEDTPYDPLGSYKESKG